MKTMGKGWALVALAAICWVGGCGDSNFSGSCSLCANGVPVGPSANQTACTAWGDESGCEAVLENEGMCGDVSATCVVTDCESEVSQCVL